jgi:hypothetical protein
MNSEQKLKDATRHLILAMQCNEYGRVGTAIDLIYEAAKEDAIAAIEAKSQRPKDDIVLLGNDWYKRVGDQLVWMKHDDSFAPQKQTKGFAPGDHTVIYASGRE